MGCLLYLLIGDSDVDLLAVSSLEYGLVTCSDRGKMKQNPSHKGVSGCQLTLRKVCWQANIPSLIDNDACCSCRYIIYLIVCVDGGL